ncbi:MAG: radical SAM protein [Candidatus Bathyarchaeia archaeon]
MYGPVLSWRLGRSLGIDIVPPPKTCTFDCVYCQLGRTVYKVSAPVEARVPKEDVLRDVKRALDLLDPGSVDHVTFSGSGEPTLNPELGGIIEGLKRLTDKPVAVLTNSSLLDKEEVRRSLTKADLVVAKLDAPSQPLLEAINRPAGGILHENIVEGLMKLRSEMSGELALQMMFLKSRGGGVTNTGEEAVEALVRLTEKSEPDEVQVNTPTRPPSERFVLALEPDRVEAIAERFRASLKHARIVSRYERKTESTPRRLGHQDIEMEVLALIERRPCRLEDIARSLDLPSEVVTEHLNQLVERGKVLAVKHGGKLYYRTQ